MFATVHIVYIMASISLSLSNQNITRYLNVPHPLIIDNSIIFIPNHNGLKLRTIINKRDDFNQQNNNTMILCHGINLSCDYGFMDYLCMSILLQCYNIHAICTFDFTGHGLSEGISEFGDYNNQV